MPLKNKIGGLIAIVVLLLGLGAVFAVHAFSPSPAYDYVSVERADLSSEIRLDGTVTPASQVDLAFETSGAVASVRVQVNDAVSTGQILATLRSADQSAAYAQASAGLQAAQAQVSVAQAAVDAQQALLDQVKAGATPQELAAAQSAVTSAESGADQARSSLSAAQAQADASMAATVSASVVSAQAAAADARSTLLALTDIQYTYDQGSDQDSATVAFAKGAAIQALFGVSGAGSWNRVSVSGLSGGIYSDIFALPTDADPATVQTDLATLSDALRSVSAAVASVPVTDAFSSTDLTTMNGLVTVTAADIQTVSGDLASIDAQAAANDATIANANAAVTAADAARAAAQAQLDIVQAGSRDEQIATQEANVRSAEANRATAQAGVAQARAAVYAASAAFGKTVLRAPMDGIVTHVDAKVGQFASASTPAVSMMSNGTEQVEAWAAQTDIPTLSVGAPATMTLDAIPDESFDATIVSIDPAPTDRAGVPSYKVTLGFAKDDVRVKPGMNANVRMASVTHPGVLAVPQSALIRRGGATYVLVDDNGPIQREVETGIVSADGRVEITRGLDEGDHIAQFGSAN